MAWLALGDSDPWAGWAPCAELAEPSYAERVHADSLLRTRANTWSNLAYVLVGLYALALAAHDRRAPRAGHVRRTPALSALLARYTGSGREGAVYGLDNSLVAGARAAAPVIGAVVATAFDLRGLFLATAVAYGLIAAIAATRLPEPRPAPARGQT